MPDRPAAPAPTRTFPAVLRSTDAERLANNIETLKTFGFSRGSEQSPTTRQGRKTGPLTQGGAGIRWKNASEATSRWVAYYKTYTKARALSQAEFALSDSQQMEKLFEDRQQNSWDSGVLSIGFTLPGDDAGSNTGLGDEAADDDHDLSCAPLSSNPPTSISFSGLLSEFDVEEDSPAPAASTSRPASQPTTALTLAPSSPSRKRGAVHNPNDSDAVERPSKQVRASLPTAPFAPDRARLSFDKEKTRLDAELAAKREEREALREERRLAMEERRLDLEERSLALEEKRLALEEKRNLWRTHRTHLLDGLTEHAPAGTGEPYTRFEKNDHSREGPRASTLDSQAMFEVRGGFGFDFRAFIVSNVTGH
ncbi:hypothetical protein BDK51DRAFT_41997 [Blyttiomyces helicus]|uniref:Uncharacterized protein n=1 Tax=Blyttiomyces helicus TaxID=388810 RepID=A0A4P9WK39_9FUNG|nr:hypothetical protein BDK51DRAFT_41997 [Blyttiomyces helicus]|eukprot:RKO93164.1 hypothetical protein BDK51DRAFT_41997 [Blyttiomyces helicus]